MTYAMMLVVLLTLAGCTLPNQPGMHAGRTFVPAVGSDGGGGGGAEAAACRAGTGAAPGRLRVSR